jgi:hypothetical protein
MVELSIADGTLTLHVKGADRLWAFKSSLEIPLAHIRSVGSGAEVATGWWHGIKFPGTNVPGVITAGTFYQHGDAIFWDVHNPDSTIAINLHDDSYDQLIVEVADPGEAIKMIQTALTK